ncbi:hypothetical protein RSOLAG22IIIB_05774 [Rhizoctonia solani]|uniref:Uncharacterized protein n=1 Tax=Rhizoctonia solani TaxID=456999 RepID=A0A0K6G9A9_9AGAM|nr:hypothetical protein RSOLAG22IIIB_05774 [Rhizoctonia solani]
MSEAELDNISHNESSDREGKVEVSVTLILDSSSVATKRNRAPGRRASVFWTKMDGSLTYTAFISLALDSLGLISPLGSQANVPFTYYYRCRAAKNAVSVTSGGTFGNLLKTVKSKTLSAVIIKFAESKLRAVGMSDSPESTGVHDDIDNLALDIPRVDNLSSLAVERGKIVGKLEARWAYGNVQLQGTQVGDQGSGSQSTLVLGNGNIPPEVLLFFRLLASATHKPESTPLTGRDPRPDNTPNLGANDTLLSFLQYVKEDHGANPARYQSVFVHDRIRPDVINDLDTVDWEKYDVPQGDIHCLKRATCAWEESRASKVSRIDAPKAEAKVPEFTIAFEHCPSPPPPGYKRSEAERLGKPREGKKGNFCWQKTFPGEAGAHTFWADLPSPTLAPNDSGLAPPGTVQLRVASGTYIDVVRAPRSEIVDGYFSDDRDDEGELKI